MIRAILVDDEPLALQLLTHKLATFKEVQVLKTFTNSLHLLEDIKDLSFNVAFLDISMPGIDGIDLAEHLLSIDPTIKIVFVSAYRDYAIQAFELNSIDFILKPFTNERLEKTITRLTQALSSASILQPESGKQLEIQCFQEFIVQYKQEFVKWKTIKIKELFAYFLTHHKELIHRDVLIETLWPDTEYSKAKIQLHTTLSHLRKTLESLGFSKVIVFTNQSYRLELVNFHCDALEMNQLVQQHINATDATIEKFEKSIQKYKGDYLELEGYDWSYTHAEHMKQQAIKLLHRMISYYTIHQDTPQLQTSLERLVLLDPYSEQALQQLLIHYLQQGKRTEAIKAYHNFKEKLIEELGISPSESTNELFNQILCANI
ncbi:response regulator [Sporosarcina sp. P21c]|uniref:response regulator n=1 Tax=Sporosarcina sp. P21c TaxID=2048255 RepID=UPI001303F6E9|nr:response regulator [Sporosarcina sp. P21c]